MESRRLPLFEDALGRKYELAVEPAACRPADDAVDGIALDEKLRKPLRVAGSRGLVLLRLR